MQITSQIWIAFEIIGKSQWDIAWHICTFLFYISFDPRTDEAYVIDPSVRFETNRDMDAEVQDDKVRIYRGCIQDLARRYRHYGERKFEVIGLWFGSRGAIGTGVLEFFERFRLDKKILPRIAEEILVASIGMINHHIYAN